VGHDREGVGGGGGVRIVTYKMKMLLFFALLSPFLDIVDMLLTKLVFLPL
jgi:hypothetical protein